MKSSKLSILIVSILFSISLGAPISFAYPNNQGDGPTPPAPLEYSENVELISQIGGATYDIAVLGDIAIIGMGPRVITLDISDPFDPFYLGQTELLNDTVFGIAAMGDLAYVANYYSGLRIIDVSDGTSPVLIGTYNTPGRAKDIAVDGAYAYIADYDFGLRIIDVSTPSAPVEIGYLDTPGYAWDLAIANGFAYVADSDKGLRIINISTPTAPFEVGSFQTPNAASGVVVEGTLAYVSDRAEGLRIIDISNPYSPTEIGFLNSPGPSTNVAIQGDYAYLTTQDDQMMIIDVTNPSSPMLIGALGFQAYIYEVLAVGDLIFIGNQQEGMRIIDVSVPSLPQEIGFYDSPTNPEGVFASGQYVYTADGASGLHIFNVSNPNAPYLEGAIDTTGDSWLVEVLGDRAYVADQAGLIIVDISNPSNPSEVGTYTSQGSITDVALSGMLAYVIYPFFGMQILDLSNPASPVEIGFVEISGDPRRVYTEGNYAYVACEDSGLSIVNIADPSDPVEIGFWSSGYKVRSVEVSGNHAYIAENQFGLRVIDISTPEAPVEVGNLFMVGPALDIAISENYAFLALGGNGFRIVDISNPAAPVEIGFYNTTSYARGIDALENRVYVADRNGGLLILQFELGELFYISGMVFNLEPPVPEMIEGVMIQASSSIIDITDAEGNYTLQVPAGTYSVSAMKDGYIFSPLTQDVTVPPSQGAISFLATRNISNVDLDVADAGIHLKIGSQDPQVPPQLKQNQPKETKFEVEVKNLGIQDAPDVIVNVYDGEPSTGTFITFSVIPLIPAQGSVTADFEIQSYTNTTNLDVYVEVIDSTGQDQLLENNVSSRGTSIQIMYAGTDQDPYKFNPDTFWFENWDMEWDDFWAEMDTHIFDFEPDSFRNIFGPGFYLLTAHGGGGHCYGMSSASIIYWDTPSEKPIQADTFVMDPPDVAADIREQHVVQLIPITINMLVNNQKSPTDAYQTIKNGLGRSTPDPSILAVQSSVGGHAVVAYKTVEVGDDEYVFIYDNEDPMETEEDVANVLHLNRASDIFEYSITGSGPYSYTAAYSTDPIHSPSDFTEEMIEDIVEYFLRQLIQQSIIRLYFTWLDAPQQDQISLDVSAPITFLVIDEFNRRIGYDQGVLVEEIPGAEMQDWGTAYYFILPSELSYTMRTSGTSADENILSIAMPLSNVQIQEIIYTGFSVPSGVEATTSFSQNTQDWHIEIEGAPAVLPTTNQTVILPSLNIYLPLVIR